MCVFVCVCVCVCLCARVCVYDVCHWQGSCLAVVLRQIHPKWMSKPISKLEWRMCVCMYSVCVAVWKGREDIQYPWTICSLLNDRLGGQYWDGDRCVQVLFVCSYSDKDVAGQRGNAIWKLYWSASGSNRVFDERISEPRPRQFQARWHFEFWAGRREVEMWSSSIDPTLLRRTMPRNKTKICVIASVNRVKWNIPLWDLVCFICQHIFWSLGFLLRSDSMPFYFCFS